MFRRKDFSTDMKFKENPEWTSLAEQNFDLDKRWGYFQVLRFLGVVGVKWWKLFFREKVRWSLEGIEVET